jgi:hypothetical protein
VLYTLVATALACQTDPLVVVSHPVYIRLSESHFSVDLSLSQVLQRPCSELQYSLSRTTFSKADLNTPINVKVEAYLKQAKVDEGTVSVIVLSPQVEVGSSGCGNGYYKPPLYQDTPGSPCSGLQKAEPGYWASGLVRYKCPSGRFASSSGNSDPSCEGPCAPGFYCQEGSVSPMQHKCQDSAFYCPEGSSAPIPVSAGFYSSDTRSR